MYIRLFRPLFRVWLLLTIRNCSFHLTTTSHLHTQRKKRFRGTTTHNNISHFTHKERNGSEEQQHSSVLTTMSAPSSPDGGNGEDDAAAVGMNYSIAEALIRRYTSACLELSSSSNSSSFASSSTFDDTRPRVWNCPHRRILQVLRRLQHLWRDCRRRF